MLAQPGTALLGANFQPGAIGFNMGAMGPRKVPVGAAVKLPPKRRRQCMGIGYGSSAGAHPVANEPKRGMTPYEKIRARLKAAQQPPSTETTAETPPVPEGSS
jgi:hypothetical protein